MVYTPTPNCLKESTGCITHPIFCMQLYNLYLHRKQVLVNLLKQNLLNKCNDEQENTLISENVIPIDTLPSATSYQHR